MENPNFFLSNSVLKQKRTTRGLFVRRHLGLMMLKCEQVEHEAASIQTVLAPECLDVIADNSNTCYATSTETLNSWTCAFKNVPVKGNVHFSCILNFHPMAE